MKYHFIEQTREWKLPEQTNTHCVVVWPMPIIWREHNYSFNYSEPTTYPVRVQWCINAYCKKNCKGQNMRDQCGEKRNEGWKSWGRQTNKLPHFIGQTPGLSSFLSNIYPLLVAVDLKLRTAILHNKVNCEYAWLFASWWAPHHDHHNQGVIEFYYSLS